MRRARRRRKAAHTRKSWVKDKKDINTLSNQWQLQAFQLAAHLGDKTKVFIKKGGPLLNPHSNCLFNTTSGWVCPLFPEAYLPQVCVQNHHFCTGKSWVKNKKDINTLSNQWQLQAFQLAAHLGDKTKVFIKKGGPLLNPHSNCLFNTISGWACPLFLEAYLPQVWDQKRDFCTGNSLLSRISNGESE